MLFELEKIVRTRNMYITGILHVGAHLGEEAQTYRNIGVENVVWIEAIAELIPELERNLKAFDKHRILNTVITDRDGGSVEFNITNNNMSSSILELGTHKIVSPDVHYVEKRALRTRTIDSLAKEFDFSDINFLNMDIQGAELIALRGAVQFLNQIDYLYLEVNKKHLYQGCALIGELDDYLRDFKRVETIMTPAHWGDAIWVRQ